MSDIEVMAPLGAEDEKFPSRWRHDLIDMQGVRLEKVIKREVTLVNKGKIAKLAQMWRLLPPNLEFWEFFAMESWLVYILGHRQKFHEKTC